MIKRIMGVDMDNTIINYDRLMHKIALKKGYIGTNAKESKNDIRDIVRQLPDGENKWQELQAVAYGQMIMDAELIKGARRFFESCRKHKITVYIISHKTEFAGWDGKKINLRKAAMAWMEKNDFFEENGLDLSRGDVYFKSTREGKIDMIERLGCTHFIDDLIETFSERKFPAGVKKILYDPHGDYDYQSGILCFKSWEDINEYFFKSG